MPHAEEHKQMALGTIKNNNFPFLEDPWNG